MASHPCFVAERGARLRLTPTAYRHLHTSKMHTMRDQHECHQHHREGECPACEVGVVLGRWLIRQFSPARHHHLHRIPKKYSRQRLADSRRLVPQKRPQRGEAEAVELSGLRDDANDRKVLLLSSRRPNGPGRDEDFSSPPAQIPACAANAPGSSLGSDVVR